MQLIGGHLASLVHSRQKWCFASSAPPMAMNYCYEIYKTEPNTRRSSAAVFLLYEVADSRVLPWIAEFLEDATMTIRWNGVMALENILAGPLGDAGIATAKQLLAKAESDPDEGLREKAREIRNRLFRTAVLACSRSGRRNTVFGFLLPPRRLCFCFMASWPPVHEAMLSQRACLRKFFNPGESGP